MTNPPNKDKQFSFLKEARQHKGIALEMVHEATKIPLDALKAIEQGYSVHKLQTFYYRGFIKIYAKFLELDETQVLQEYGLQESAAPKPQHSFVKETKVSESVGPTKKIVKNIIQPVLDNDIWAKRFGQLGKVIVYLVVLFFLFKISGCFISNLKVPQKKAEVSKSVNKPVIKAPVKTSVKTKSKENIEKNERSEASQKTAVAAVTEPSMEDKAETGKTSAASETKQEKKSQHIELTVRATKNGWLQVKSDGQVIFQSTLRKGDSETWKARTEIELSGRNINLLEFELNGKMLGALGASDRGAKKVVFTKDGLSVKK